jgi:hypothetical protein
VPGGLLGQRYGQRFVGFAGALLFASGGVWWRTHMGATPSYASEFLPAQLLGGAGVGLVLPTLSAAATAPLPPARFATGTAVLGMSRQLGTALGVAILVAILGHPSPATALGAFRDGWDFMIASVLAAGVVLLSVGPVRVAAAEPSVAEIPTAGPATELAA